MTTLRSSNRGYRTAEADLFGISLFIASPRLTELLITDTERVNLAG